MPSRVDLHTHSTASDGTLTPLDVFDRAAELQVRVLALSDHDSTAGYDQILPQQSRHPDVRLIPAIELNAEGDLGCHLLGYFINPKNKVFQERLTQLREARAVRSQEMVKRLSKAGYPIRFERVQELAKGGSIGRPHLADALREAGYVRSRKEAFDRFLKKDGLAYVSSDGPSAAESITLIRHAGGVPVLAHPAYSTSEDQLKSLVGIGLMGIEAYYPDHSRGLIKRYLELADQYGLVATGGSDFHGPGTGRAALASVDVPETVVLALEKAKERV